MFILLMTVKSAQYPNPSGNASFPQNYQQSSIQTAAPSSGNKIPLPFPGGPIFPPFPAPPPHGQSSLPPSQPPFTPPGNNPAQYSPQHTQPSSFSGAPPQHPQLPSSQQQPSFQQPSAPPAQYSPLQCPPTYSPQVDPDKERLKLENIRLQQQVQDLNKSLKEWQQYADALKKETTGKDSEICNLKQQLGLKDTELSTQREGWARDRAELDRYKASEPLHHELNSKGLEFVTLLQKMLGSTQAPHAAPSSASLFPRSDSFTPPSSTPFPPPPPLAPAAPPPLSWPTQSSSSALPSYSPSALLNQSPPLQTAQQVFPGQNQLPISASTNPPPFNPQQHGPRIAPSNNLRFAAPSPTPTQLSDGYPGRAHSLPRNISMAPPIHGAPTATPQQQSGQAAPSSGYLVQPAAATQQHPAPTETRQQNEIPCCAHLSGEGCMFSTRCKYSHDTLGQFSYPCSYVFNHPERKCKNNNHNDHDKRATR